MIDTATHSASLPFRTATPHPSSAAPDPLSWRDAVAIFLSMALLLLISFLRSRHTIFWSDEVMGWLVLREPTLASLLHSWWAGADSSGFLFYLLGRPWLALFGATDLSLRLFSAAGVALALGLLFLCARRFYRFAVVAPVLPLTFLLSPTLIWQLSNGRTYGVFLAAIALTALAFALTDPAHTANTPAIPHAARPLSPRLLALTFLAHLCLVSSHILGPLYSGVFLAGLIVRDLLLGTVRPRLYLAGLAGWIGLALSYRNLVATAALGKPAFWTIKPHRHDLFLGFVDGNRHLRGTILLLAMSALLLLLRQARGRRFPLIPRSSITQLTLIGTFLTCVPVLFLLSRVTTSVFVDRYLLPIILGDALLLCELLTRILDGLRPPRLLERALFAVALLAIPLAVKRDLPLNALGYPQRDYTADLLARIPPGTPAIITNPGIFAEMVFYQNPHATFLTPIDWPITLDPTMHSGYVSGTHEMENWKRLGYFASQIQPTATLLASHPTFLVIAEQDQDAWFRHRVEQTGAYTTEDLGAHLEAGNPLHLWLATRR